MSKSKLRRSLLAPPGHKVVVADLGPIEARLTAWFCHSCVLMNAFEAKRDPYALLAAEIFGRPVDPKVDKLERFIGKSGVLGLGYGAGAPKFYTMVIRSARALGMTLDMNFWTMDLAERSVRTYRNVNGEIPRMWQFLDGVLRREWMGLGASKMVGPVKIGYGVVIGPNLLEMRYDGPRLEITSGVITYGYGGRRHKIYGAKFLENIIQFLARIILMNTAMRLADRGYRFALQAHDELAFIVRDADVDNATKIIHEEMVRHPSWAPDLPLTADVGVGQSYGEAK